MKFNIWEDYEYKDLPEVLSFIVDNRGKTVPTDPEGKHILIATNCILNSSLFPIYENVRTLSEDTYNNWFRSHPEPGDIIFVNKGSNNGKVCMVPEPVDFCIAQDMVALRTNSDIVYNKYLFAFLRSYKIQRQIKDTSIGDAIPHFKKSLFKEIKVPVPPMEVQKLIGDYYYLLCEKIECNKKINSNLLEQARLLYKSWFIDFDSNDGDMPDDWHVGTVSEIIELHDSKRKPLSGNERDKLEKIYPYYGATSIMDYVDDYLFDGIYLLLGEDGSVIDAEGYPILQYVFGKFWCNNHAHIITGKNGFSVEMLYLLFSLTHVNDIVTGAVQLKISQQNLNKVEAVIPSLSALREFDELIQPMFGQIRKLRSENENLTTLRDSLLPKLMSGELNVSNLDI